MIITFIYSRSLDVINGMHRNYDILKSNYDEKKDGEKEKEDK